MAFSSESREGEALQPAPAVPQIEAAGLRVPPAELHETDYRLGDGNGCSNAQEHATNNRDQPDNLAHVILY